MCCPILFQAPCTIIFLFLSTFYYGNAALLKWKNRSVLVPYTFDYKLCYLMWYPYDICFSHHGGILQHLSIVQKWRKLLILIMLFFSIESNSNYDHWPFQGPSMLTSCILIRKTPLFLLYWDAPVSSLNCTPIFAKK